MLKKSQNPYIFVMPAEAGIQSEPQNRQFFAGFWIPASAGMTVLR
jgi:hypothetical protein